MGESISVAGRIFPSRGCRLATSSVPIANQRLMRVLLYFSPSSSTRLYRLPGKLGCQRPAFGLGWHIVQR